MRCWEGGRTTDDAMSYPREEWMQREDPCLGLPLPKALNKAGEGGLSEPQAPRGMLLGPCSSPVEWVGGGRTTLNLVNWSSRRQWGCSLEELDIVCRKESKVAMATAPPPAFIHHLNVSDDVIWIKGELVASLWGGS